jgi:hypothetical protein
LTVFPAVSSSRSMFALNRGRSRVYALNSYGSSVFVIADTLLAGLQADGGVRNRPMRAVQTVVRGVLFLPGDRGPETAQCSSTSAGARCLT